jgi:hypothetical protein
MHDDCTPAERRKRREARSAKRRAQALALRQQGGTYSSIGLALGVSVARARQLVRKAERLANEPHWHDGLPARAVNLLIISGIAGLPEQEAGEAIAHLSRREALAFPNFGIGALTALVDWLATLSLELRQDDGGRADHGHSSESPAGRQDRSGPQRNFADERRCQYDDLARRASGRWAAARAPG